MTDCNDASDEIGCKCKEYLLSGKMCDGFFDCLDGEDEIDCDCSPGRFKCT